MESSENQHSRVVDLKAGKSFAVPLLNADGSVLLPAGEEICREFLEDLRNRGIHEVFLPSATVDQPAQAALDRIAPYDPVVKREIAAKFEETVAAIIDLAHQARSGRLTRTDEIESTIYAYLSLAARDAGVVIATCMEDDGLATSHDEWLAKRSVRLSTLSAVTAVAMNMVEADCVTAGLVGALHDVSLYGKKYRDTDSFYLDHPIRSIEMLSGTFGVSEQMKVIIGQVHEQFDGSGFPRKISGSRIHPVSRLLNVVDAFLSLTDPEDDVPAFFPADALIYLVQQSIYGVFEGPAVQALLRVESAYPVGTEVQLSDGTIAVVLRSTGASYLQPVVIRNDGSIVDLTSGACSIEGPIDRAGRKERIPKQSFSKVLWQSEELASLLSTSNDAGDNAVAS